MAGFLNRYNDSLATVTDDESSKWAAQNLATLGWDIGKHVGNPEERRSGPPGSWKLSWSARANVASLCVSAALYGAYVTTISGQAADTTPEAQVVDQLTAACTTMALTGIRLQNAALSPDGVRRELAARRHGRALAEAAYGRGTESTR